MDGGKRMSCYISEANLNGKSSINDVSVIISGRGKQSWAQSNFRGFVIIIRTNPASYYISANSCTKKT
jgi:hypothetical protein